MKTLQYILLSLTITCQCIAYDVPKDAVIKVYTANGKQIGHMSRSEYKVVKIRKARTSPEDKLLSAVRNNVVILHAGIGKDGLRNSHDGTQHIVDEKGQAVGGLTYCRKAGTWGMCGSIFTNAMFTLGIMKEF